LPHISSDLPGCSAGRA